MCANFKPIKREHINHFISAPQSGLAYAEEAWPGSLCPILTTGEQADSGMEWKIARFGLVPFWSNDLKISRKTYNVRSETAETKPSFRSAWKARRFALVPMTCFFEPNYASGKAVRWRIYRNDHAPFTVAALWETWKNPASSELLYSFSMLTINADQHSLMRQFHAPEDEKRSLVVVAPENRITWLTASHHDAIALLQDIPCNEFVSEAAPLQRNR